jgi:hypothetical protein
LAARLGVKFGAAQRKQWTLGTGQYDSAAEPLANFLETPARLILLRKQDNSPFKGRPSHLQLASRVSTAADSQEDAVAHGHGQ